MPEPADQEAELLGVREPGDIRDCLVEHRDHRQEGKDHHHRDRDGCRHHLIFAEASDRSADHHRDQYTESHDQEIESEHGSGISSGDADDGRAEHAQGPDVASDADQVLDRPDIRH